MADDSEVIRDAGISKRTMDRIFRDRMREWGVTFKAYKMPEEMDLIRAVEANTKCAKCGSAIRCVFMDMQKSESFECDLHFLASISCSSTECGWNVRQWRTWVRTRPKEL